MQESESYIVKASKYATELLVNVDSLKNQLDSYRPLKEKEHLGRQYKKNYVLNGHIIVMP